MNFRPLLHKLSRLPGCKWMRPKTEKPFVWRPARLGYAEVEILTVIWWQGRTFEIGRKFYADELVHEYEKHMHDLCIPMKRALKGAGHPQFQGPREFKSRPASL